MDAIYLNFAKAFDKVEYAILIPKLRNLGFGSNISKLIESYLQDRIQVVNIKGCRFSEVNESSGVPQGRILGPILFAFCINDLFLFIRYCKALSFLDDCKLFHKIANIEDSMNI